ncbi:hypothetical protein [Demequina globuliformis]|uniref:hypothetical protein n=1 Tax=Demequina globuliformis TaxID=676202 RepID=UPI0007805BDC|nr:hypothetical protein [Demequina globuliformis]
MQSSSRLALMLRTLLVVAVFVAGAVGIVGAWQHLGGAPLGVVLATVLFMGVFSAGGLAMRKRSRGAWWGFLAFLWLILLTQAPSTEWLALPMLAMAAATETFAVAGIAAAVAVVAVAVVGVAELSALAVVIFACAAGLALLAGLGYRRVTAPTA